MRDASPGNPYDFRSPVQRRHLLAARARELHEIDELLRRAAVGRPVHLSLFGAAGSGKSSLLNSVGAIATERQLLPIKLELRDTTVESELAFYGTVFDAGLQALVDVGALRPSDPVMRGWVRQARAGDLGVSQEEQPLELGMMLAAKANGKMIGSLPAPALKRDLQRLVELGSCCDVRGVVVCLDSAENIDQNEDLAPSLLELANSSSLLTVVTAAEKAGTLQATAPRAWARIEVVPFARPQDVYEAMVRPLQDAEEADLWPSVATAVDVHALTRGHPYEVNLVSYFIWEAVHLGDQVAFELSPAVIERVLGELEEKGRHETSADFAALAQLTSADYTVLADLAPYEKLTVRQIALLRLLPETYDDEQLVEAEAQVVSDLDRLAARNLLRVERDRFELHGASDARLYLKYAAQRVTGKRLRFRDTYERQVTVAFSSGLGEALVGAAYDDALLYGQGEPYEVGGVRTVTWVRELRDSIEQRNIVRFSEMLFDTAAIADVNAAGEHGGIFVGLLLQVGVHEVQHAELLANPSADSQADLRQRAVAWVEDQSPLLLKYDIQVVEHHCVVVSSELLAAVAVYAELKSMFATTMIMYDAGSTQDALDMLADTVQRGEALIGESPADPLIRSELAEALNRLGFMSATLGQLEAALVRFQRCEELGLQDSWLLDFNRGYVHARLEHPREAARFATAAEAEVVPYDAGVILLSCPPTPDDWVAPTPEWNIVRLKGGWVPRFVGLQAAVLRAKADPGALPALQALVDGLSPVAPPALLRIAAWTDAVLLGRPARAIEGFQRALDASRLNEMDDVRAELQFVRSRYGPGSADSAGVAVAPPRTQ